MDRTIRNLILISLAFFTTATAVADEPVVTIACLTDIHSMNGMLTPSSGNISDIKARASFVNTVNQLREQDDIDILLLGGDYQTDKTIPESNFRKEREVLSQVSHKAFREGKKPYVLWMSGNHEYEVANFGKLPKPYNAGDYYTFPMKDELGELSSDDAFYEQADNDDSGKMKLLAAYHYYILGCHFVVLNCGKVFFANAGNYSYSDESVKWVADKLDAIYLNEPTARVFFMVHVPFSESNSLNQGKGMNDNTATRNLKKVLSSHPGLVMLYGHDHGGETAYTHFLSSQRATVYATDGSLMPTSDADHVNSPLPEEDKLIRNDSEGLIHAGEFNLYNPYSGKYLSVGSKNFTLDSTEVNIRVAQASEGLFNISHYVTYKISNLHHSAKELFCRGTASQFLLFRVEDPSATLPHAVRAYGLRPGESYVIVAKETDACYALTGSLYKEGTDDECMSHVKVELSGDSIHYLYPVSANRTVWNFHPSSSSFCDPVADHEGRVGIGLFTLWNAYAQKYLCIDSHNLGLSATSHNFTLDNKNGTCRLISTYDFTKYSLHIGKDGLYSRGDASEILLFRVENPDAALPHAVRAYRVKSGETYMIVSKDDSLYYAMTGNVYKEGSDSQRMSRVQVEIDSDTIRFLYPKSANRTLWTLRDPEVRTPSFMSLFMGSMRYYYNAIDAGDPADSPTVVQGLIIKVYKDRMVFQMKNFGKSGIINGSIVAAEPSSYTVYYPDITSITPLTPNSSLLTPNSSLPTPNSSLLTPNSDKSAYNLAGQVVNDSYHGIVIKNGKKYLYQY